MSIIEKYKKCLYLFMPPMICLFLGFWLYCKRQNASETLNASSFYTGGHYLIPDIDVSNDVDLIQYYQISQINRLSEAAFVLATDVYLELYTEAERSIVHLNNTQNEYVTSPLSALGYLKAFEQILEQKGGLACRRKALEKVALAKSDFEIGIEKDPEILRTINAISDAILDDFRIESEIAARLKMRHVNFADSRETIEAGLKKFDPNTYKYILKFHRVIFECWREYQKGLQTNNNSAENGATR